MYPYLQTPISRKLLFSFLIMMTGFWSVKAQTVLPFNNEWINYSQTYFKFKIASNGVVRISQPVLAANGMGSVNAQNFQLWRNGVQVPMYTTIATGVLSATDYLEFYGVMNDGLPDKDLYYATGYQLNNRTSLETDSSTYFLTYNTAQLGIRYSDAANNVATNTLPAEPYLMYTEKYNFKDIINRGFADPNPGEYIYSSSYDAGEMLSSQEIYSSLNGGYTFPDVYKRNFYPAAGGGNVTLTAAAMGTALNSRNIEFRLGNNVLGTMNLYTFEAKAQTYPNLPLSVIPSGTGSFIIKNLAANSNDRVAVSYMDITYPRLYNFDNRTAFEFELPAAATRYLEITNFNRGSGIPVLYNLTNRQRYVANISAAGVIRFVLPGSEASYVLLSEDAGAVTYANSLQQRTFVNYNASSQQGDYLIISNSALFTPVGGSNPVEQYRLYRSSTTGGAYNAKTYDIDQIEDQFAFGIKKHPISIRNFLRSVRQNFTTTPKFAFIIGKGVSYQDYRFQQQQPYADKLNLVPTFGYPGSDILLSSIGTNPYPLTAIGRLSAINGQEIVDYLNKLKTYEALQLNPSATQQDQLWTKNIAHVIGTSDEGTASLITPYMDDYTRIIQDTLYGASVTTLNKYSTGTAATINTQVLDNLFQNGMSMLTYFGHSSATALDYNLADPNSYNNPNKYPMFLLLGCNAGNIFDLDPTRLNLRTTISEKYVLTPSRGSIGMIASSSFGLVDYLGLYSKGFYLSLAKQGYGQSVGKNIQDAIQYSYGFAIPNANEYGIRLHAEQQTLHGDPAVKINYHQLPDYSIEQANIFTNPTLISVAENSFNVKAYFYNIGKAIKDSITVQVRRQYPQSDIYPNGFTDIVYNKKIPATRYIDSLEITLPVVANRDKGTNRITVSLETENRITELSKANNVASRDVVIFEDEMRPVYPYSFAIVNRQGIKLVASTSSPVTATARPYRMELDTTEFFNSPLKVTRNITIAGGTAEFDPGITFSDSTVYYWRLAPVPATGQPDRWNTSSFIYLAQSTSTGFNQSHVFQHLKSGVDKIKMDSASRKWGFTTHQNNLFVTHSVYGVSGGETIHFSVSVNGDNYIRSACVGHSLIFNVFDPVTFKPWINLNGQFGSGPACQAYRFYNFEWDDRIPANRDSMKRFMDAIPNGAYVVVRNILDQPFANESFAPAWQADEQTMGAGNSLYSRLKATGWTQIDSFNRPRIFSLIYRKGDPSFTKWKFSSDNLERIELNVNCPTPDTLGYVTSPLFGPARSWKSVKWRGETVDTRLGDVPTVTVIGVNNAGNETPLYNLNTSQQDFDLSAVDSIRYPFLRLRLRNADSINGTAWNLRYWRLLYNPVPEGALAANLSFIGKDSVDQAETYSFAIPFKNISDVAFRDSIKIKAVLLDRSNVPHVLQLGRKKALAPGDTTNVAFTIDTKPYPGTNNLYLEMNPVDSAQLEQYHFNNFIYRDFYVRPDNYNPLMDVTFDGVHILNRDIVSSRPHIQIKLKDESKFLLLNDTSLMKLTLRFPDGSTRSYRFGTDTLRFTPATSGANNTSTIDFYPSLTQDVDAASGNAFYDMTVSGKDVLNNAAGPSSYNVSFQVFNKPMISNLFNYPNPFTTSTAFVFTITGNEVPQEFKIQILTVTGKIVREITKPELGPLTVGRNITEYKWDGTDQYGGKLANGVYLYRVVTSLNGNKMEHFRINEGYDQNVQDQTDKYFNKGYGKMYLMR